jgi:hypothetical protein
MHLHLLCWRWWLVEDSCGVVIILQNSDCGEVELRVGVVDVVEGDDENGDGEVWKVTMMKVEAVSSVFLGFVAIVHDRNVGSDVVDAAEFAMVDVDVTMT